MNRAGGLLSVATVLVIALVNPWCDQVVAAAETATTLAMEAGVTFDFQIPKGFALRERSSPVIGCSSMIWMRPDAKNEEDGSELQVAVLTPNDDMLKAMHDQPVAHIAQSIVEGKAQAWQEFHPAKQTEQTIANLKFVRTDFEGVRKTGAPKILGFQLIAEYQEKLISIVVEVPEQLKDDLRTFDHLVGSMQVQ